MNKLKCPNCNGPVVEISSIAPALVKCENCQTTFEASFVRGYWHNRPDIVLTLENLLRFIEHPTINEIIKQLTREIENDHFYPESKPGPEIIAARDITISYMQRVWPDYAPESSRMR